MPDDASRPVVVFDGECGFCNASINFILDHEATPALRFAPAQGQFGQATAARHNLPAGKPGSMILIEKDRCFVRSTAALRIARYLRAPWSWLALGLYVPRPLRDAVYGWISTHRHQLSRGQAQCRAATPDMRERFLP